VDVTDYIPYTIALSISVKSLNDFDTKRKQLGDFQLEVLAEPSSHKLSIKVRVRVAISDFENFSYHCTNIE
jgi:hypothetical protein